MARASAAAARKDARSRAANDDTEQAVMDPRGKKLARLLQKERKLVGERDSASKQFAEQIKELRQEINSLAEEITTGQGTLFTDAAE